MDDIKRLQQMIDEVDTIVVFTGAGVSTESGLKDFRSKDGLYNQNLDYPAEYLLSRECFYNNPELFYKFYKTYMNALGYNPNVTHYFFKKLEDIGKLKGIITQNIDGLHTKAGSKKVYEIHGTILDNHCVKCNKYYDAEYVFNSKGVPKCECGGIIKPDVILYGEMLPEEAYNGAIDIISKADMLIVAGTSLTVSPSNMMIYHFRGKYLVIINNDKTDFDNRADLVINKRLSEIFNYINA